MNDFQFYHRLYSGFFGIVQQIPYPAEICKQMNFDYIKFVERK